MKLYLVINTRTKLVMWQGSKKDCKWWLRMTNPDNAKHYKIVKAKEGK